MSRDPDGTPVAIDLFCGCGGLTLGLKHAGFRVGGAVDIDATAVKSFKLNHPEVHTWRRNVRWLPVTLVRRKLGLKPGELDLLAGCPPCQGFSTLRTLNGGRVIEDPRNDLLFEFLRFVKGLRPRSVMMENVPGLRTDHRMTIFLDKLGRLGYSCKVAVLDAADYGVPQRRRRLILLASRVGNVEFADKMTDKRTVRDAIGSLPQAGASGDLLHDVPEARTDRVQRIIVAIPKDGGSRRALGNHLQLACHRKCDGFKDVYGRMKWEDVSPTITSGCFNPSKGRFLHPEEDRAITLREAALLQSFPSDYYISLDRGKGHAASLIGNALPPRFVELHARSLAAQG